VATKMRSLRLADDLWEWAGAEAERLGTTRTGLVCALLVKARDGGVVLGSVVPGGARVPSPRSGGRLSSGPTRIDSVDQARVWMAERQARLNKAREKAS
jgi:hypothetical protein